MPQYRDSFELGKGAAGCPQRLPDVKRSVHRQQEPHEHSQPRLPVPPQSVAVIGASNRPHSVGATVLAQPDARPALPGPICAVNPKHDAAGRRAGLPPTWPTCRKRRTWRCICTPPATVPGLIAELGARGTRAAIVLTAGLARSATPPASASSRRCSTRPGPTCCASSGRTASACWRPRIGLNASFAPHRRAAGQARLRLAVGRAGDRGAGLGQGRAASAFRTFVSLGEQRRRRFRRHARLPGQRRRRPAPSCCTSRSIRDAAQVHVGRARRGAQQAGDRGQGRARRRKARSAAASHTGALAGSDDGLRRRHPPRRHAARR